MNHVNLLSGFWSTVPVVAGGGGGGLPVALGGLYGWGTGTTGQLNNSSALTKSSPVQVGALSYIWASSSGTRSHGIKSDGTLWAWGNAANGALGNGTITPNLSSPVQIGALSWKMVCGSGNGYTLAIRSDGLLFAWGIGTSGDLGDGTTVGKSSPVQIGSSSWLMVSAGGPNGATSVGIDIAGRLFTWGDSTSGSLGNGTSTPDVSSPVQIGSSSWKWCSMGSDSCSAIKLDDTLWSWGGNFLGTAGDGTTTAHSSPVQMGSLSWKYVTQSSNYAVAVRSDNLLFSWGTNANGELGDGTTVGKSSPVQIGSSSWLMPSLQGGTNACGAIRLDGLLFMWGQGATGAIGDGTNVGKSSPVQIGSSSWQFLSTGGHILGIKAP